MTRGAISVPPCATSKVASALLLAALGFTLTAGDLAAQTVPTIWHSVGIEGEPLLVDLERQLRGFVKLHSSTFTEQEHITLEGERGLTALDERLAADSEALVFVYCSLQRCRPLLSDTLLMRRHDLELINPRVISLPFYVFHRGGDFNTATSESDTLRIGYYAPPGHIVRAADVRELVRAVYGDAERIQTATLVPTQDDLQGLADRFIVRGRYDLVAIYDEEPSPVLDRLLGADRRGRTELWEASEEVGTYRPESRRRGNLVYALVPLGEQRFYRDSAFAAHPDSAGIVVIPRSDSVSAVLPVLLSNARSRRPTLVDSLNVVLSDYYVSTVAPLVEPQNIERQSPVGMLRAGTPQSTAFSRTLLLNAHLADSDNPFKALSLYSHYQMSDQPFDRVTYRRMAELMKERIRPDDLREALRAEFGDPQPNARTRFANCGEKYFWQARMLAQVPDSLEAARELLLSALTVWEEAGRQRCSGMWSTKHYDPYYYLALIDARLREATGR